MYFDNSRGAKTPTQATKGIKDVEVKDGLNYAFKTGEYTRKISCHESQVKV